MYEKIILVTRTTPLGELVARLNSRDQARFYLQQNGISFSDYELADRNYQQAVAAIQRQIPRSVKYQQIDRLQLPQFQFSERDLVIALGQDGLVINIAKYLSSQPILAINPDPARFDGMLLPFTTAEAGAIIERALRGAVQTSPISMARVTLNDGQTLDAVNDLFIGPRSHGSARYQLQLGHASENQSSSGIIISTGAGCSGWLRSIVAGAWQVASYFGAEGTPPTAEQLALGWGSDRLWFTVREPFVSRTSQATLVFGQIMPGQQLTITSHMPDYGTIFSDGIESDYLAFNAGTIAHIGLSERQARLIIRSA